MPIGIQTLSEIVNNGYLYVDKTKYVYNLINTGKYYFFSRPRRFGKSLTCSTIESIFRGDKELFKGLWIYDADWEWEKHPIIHLSFNTIGHENPENLEISLLYRLKEIATINNIKVNGNVTSKILFDFLVKQLSNKNKVVLIIDEYDKPIIEHLDDKELAVKMRKALSNFYETIKGLDEHLRFVFMTGVTKFSRTSVFSKLNSLSDISILKKGEKLVGITQQELETNFIQRIEALAEKENLNKNEILKKIKYWYNGYKFWKESNETIYNPFSLISLFESQSFENFWFSSGTPTFLIEMIKQKNYPIPEIEHALISEAENDSYDVYNMNLLPLLWQTGYLTIKGYNKRLRTYILGYPSFEVKESMNYRLFELITTTRPSQYSRIFDKIKQSLEDGEIESFCKLLIPLFARIPYNIQIPKERYYQSVLYVLLDLLGFDIQVEDETNTGRIDAVIQEGDYIYILEFKLNKTPEEGLKQIEEKEYFQKYLAEGKTILIAGINFNLNEKNVDSNFLFKTI